jgi:hypothetical protein
LPGAGFSRGYIQHWNQGQAISEHSAQQSVHAGLVFDLSRQFLDLLRLFNQF